MKCALHAIPCTYFCRGHTTEQGTGRRDIVYGTRTRNNTQWGNVHNTYVVPYYHRLKPVKMSFRRTLNVQNSAVRSKAQAQKRFGGSCCLRTYVSCCISDNSPAMASTASDISGTVVSTVKRVVAQNNFKAVVAIIHRSCSEEICLRWQILIGSLSPASRSYSPFATH